jgi:hypothetical protein
VSPAPGRGEAAPPAEVSGVALHGRRAAVTWRAVTAGRLYSRRRHLFGRRRWPVRREYEHLWPFADAWSAAATLGALDVGRAARSVLASLPAGLGAYHRLASAALDASGPVGFESSVVAPLGPGGDVYFDDNAWLGLALVHHHDLRPADGALALARRLLTFVTSGWSEQADWRHPGGIRWKEPASTTSRNTCSNGPVAELAALVHERTGDDEARDWAVRVYEWVRGALLGPDGLYFDRIAPDGTLGPEIWAYNQGTMIGAGVLLHRITGEPVYLEQATTTARAAMSRFDVPELLAQDVSFVAVLVRNLLLLDAVAPDPAYRRLAVAYADAMWATRRDARTGLFSGQASPLNNSAPMVEIDALLAGSPAHA